VRRWSWPTSKAR